MQEKIKIIIAIILILFVLTNFYKFYKDKNRSYENSGVKFHFKFNDNGTVYLLVRYSKYTESKKLEYILKKFTPGKIVSDVNSNNYKITLLLQREYYENNNGGIKTGPYVLYKVIPTLETSEMNVNFNDVNGPVQVNNNSYGILNITETEFINKINKYKNIMQEHGISNTDIEVLIKYADDEKVKESFLDRYGLILAGITIDVAGTLINLLSYLK